MTRFPPLWQQNSTYPADVDRQLITALWPTGAASGGAVTVVGGTMQVAVAPLVAAVPVGQTCELVVSNASENVTLAAAPPGGQNRYDLIVAQVRDATLDGGANNDWQLAAVTGSAGASPSVPAVPVRALALAQVLVVGGSAFLTAGNVVDRRPAPLTANRDHAQAYYAALSANTGGFGATAVDIGLGGTVFIPEAGHRYRVQSDMVFSQTTAATPAARNNLLIDGVTVAGAVCAIPAGGFQTCHLTYRWTPAAGSHTIAVQVSTDAGAAAVLGAAPYQSWVAIDDLGLA